MPDPEHVPSSALVQLERTDTESVIHLHGDVDLFNAGELRACLEDLADSGETHVVLDLADLEFIDSSGLGAVIGGMRRLAAVAVRSSCARRAPAPPVSSTRPA